MKSVRGDLQKVRFGAFELDLSARELRKQGLRVRLQADQRYISLVQFMNFPS
jgi:hypothetical protein